MGGAEGFDGPLLKKTTSFRGEKEGPQILHHFHHHPQIPSLSFISSSSLPLIQDLSLSLSLVSFLNFLQF